MQILLINPPIPKKDVYARYSSGAPCLPPLGLCYLAAVLLKSGHEVKILDCVAEDIPIHQLCIEGEKYKPGIAGVTSTTVSYEAAKKAIKAIKTGNDQVITILGGAHMSALPEETMKDCKEVDIGVLGEGEYTLLEIVENIKKGKGLNHVKGIIQRNGGDVNIEAPRPPITDLDKIPFPARHLLKDLRLYTHTPFRGAKFMTTMITSRGCPFNCGYCDQSIFGRGWRAYSSDYVISEINCLVKEYGIDFISFEDDNFLLSKKRVMEICQKIIENSFNIGWTCLGRANEVDEEVLPLMKRAGCKSIYVGVESGSPRILELIDKKLTLGDVENGIKLIKKFGINVTASFIIGLPTETQEELQRTIDLSLSLPIDGASFFIYTPYPNTKLRELAFKHGRVSQNWGDYSGHPKSLPFVPCMFDDTYLLKMQSHAYRKFLLRPGYLIKHLNSFANRRMVKKGLQFIKSLLLN